MNYDAMDEYQKNVDSLFEDEWCEDAWYADEVYENAMYENEINNQIEAYFEDYI